MKPDGVGTDSYDPPDSQRPRARATNSVERDVARLALAFVVLALIVCGGIWLSKRQYEVPPSSSDPTAQPSP